MCAQAIFGVTAVIMPGTQLGDGCVLGAIAAADVGQELAGGTLHMGVPAVPTTKHQTGAAARPCAQRSTCGVLPCARVLPCDRSPGPRQCRACMLPHGNNEQDGGSLPGSCSAGGLEASVKWHVGEPWAGACGAGPVITPKGAFQHALFWTMPLAQPLCILLIAALAFFCVAFAACAALHYQPYVAPLLLLPAFWLALFALMLNLLACAKWALLGRVRPGAYEKYSWAFQTKTLYTALTVRPRAGARRCSCCAHGIVIGFCQRSPSARRPCLPCAVAWLLCCGMPD